MYTGRQKVWRVGGVWNSGGQSESFCYAGFADSVSPSKISNSSLCSTCRDADLEDVAGAGAVAVLALEDSISRRWARHIRK